MKIKCLWFAMLLVALCACEHSPQQNHYCINGKLSDKDDNMKRLLTGVSAVLTDKSGTVVYDGQVNLQDTISCRYSISDIPSGTYDLRFVGQYYHAVNREIQVDGDVNLDVELEPVRVVTVDHEEIRFEPRVETRSLTLTNESEQDVMFFITIDSELLTSCIVELSSPGLDRSSSGWAGYLRGSQSMTINIDVKRWQMGVVEGDFRIMASMPYGHENILIPMIVETSELDMSANVRGTVRDTAGNPLKGVAMFDHVTETFEFTDENGEYSFDYIPSTSSMIQVVAYSEYHMSQRLSEEYDVKEFVMDFTLEPVQNHITFDKKTIDFGSGVIVQGAEKETIEVNATSDAGGIVGFSVIRANRDIDFAISCNPASGAFNGSTKFVFSLARERSDGPGEYMSHFIITTQDAGSYIFPVTYTIVE